MMLRSILRFTFISALFFISCRRDPDIITPIVLIEPFPITGDTSTYFCFDGSNSADNQSEIWQLRFQWDFDNDGIWDTKLSSEPKYVWKFSSYGIKTVVLGVTDHQGNMGKTSRDITLAPIFDDSVFVDSRDENQYRVVRIDTLWWMAENLRFGKEIPKGALPSDNGVVEKITFRDSLNQIVNYSGYYNWNEATHYGKSKVQGICPEGWRLTDYADYLFLYKRFVLYLDPYNLFKPGGYLGLDLTPDGLYSFIDGSFSHHRELGFLLISQKSVIDDPYENFLLYYHSSYYFPYIFYSGYGDEGQYPVWWDLESWGNNMDFNKIAINVRCVKSGK